MKLLKWWLLGVVIIIGVDYQWILKAQTKQLARLRNQSLPHSPTLFEPDCSPTVALNGQMNPAKVSAALINHLGVHKMRLKSFQMAESKHVGWEATLPVKLQFYASFLQMITWLEDLYQISFGLNIQQLQVKRLITKQKKGVPPQALPLLVNLEGELLSLQGKLNAAPIQFGEQLRAITKNLHQVRSPFLLSSEDFRPTGRHFKTNPELTMLSSEPMEVKAPLAHVSVSQLNLVGIVSIQGQRFGVIKDSVGHIHLVTQGMTIGLHQGQITSITEDIVYIEETNHDFNQPMPYRYTLQLGKGLKE